MWGICRHLFLSLFQRNNLVPVWSFDDFDADLVKRTGTIHDMQLKGWYLSLRRLSDVPVERKVRITKSPLRKLEKDLPPSVQVSTLGWIIFSSRKTEKSPSIRIIKCINHLSRCHIKKNSSLFNQFTSCKKPPRSYLKSSIIRLLAIILKSKYCEMN